VKNKLMIMKKLNSKTHSVIDYLVVILLFLSPTLLCLPCPLSTFAYMLATVHLALTVLTDFQFGLLKFIPFRIHGWIEFVVAVALIASPLVLQFYAPPTYILDRYFLSGVGVVVLVTWFATDYSVEH
jgi:hypothetical protein